MARHVNDCQEKLPLSQCNGKCLSLNFRQTKNHWNIKAIKWLLIFIKIHILEWIGEGFELYWPLVYFPVVKTQPALSKPSRWVKDLPIFLASVTPVLLQWEPREHAPSQFSNHPVILFKISTCSLLFSPYVDQNEAAWFPRYFLL